MDSLFGITFAKWIELLKENHFKISINKLWFCLLITIISLRTSFNYRRIRVITDDPKPLKKDPIFILGHWRSGTTLLHNLLIQDDQFHYPKIFEVIQPSTFMNIRKNYLEILKKRKVKNRPMDNVKNDPMLPGEEEMAVAALTLKSPLVGWAFPSKFDFYEQYLSFDDVNGDEREAWKKEYDSYLRKISIDTEKQLILKSPTNTARIKLLLELYPNAKFINIHRNPINVFKSTRRLHQTAIKLTNLQSNVKYDIDSRILSTYRKLYEAYFKYSNFISKSNLVNVSFEELENKSEIIIEKLYSELGLSNYEVMKPKLISYLGTLEGYKKNNHIEIEENTRKRIIEEWSQIYKNWGYAI